MVTPFFIGRKILFQDIGEKENFKNKKDNEKFDQDNEPNRFAPGHVLKPFEIEIENPFEKCHLLYLKLDVLNL
jgi:hypothetical protein